MTPRLISRARTRPAPRSTITAVLLVFALCAGVLGVTLPAANAASPGIDKVLDAAKQTLRNGDGTFASGRQVVFTVAVSCFDDGTSSECGDFVLTDPAPTFTDVDGITRALTFVGANAGPRRSR